MNKLLVKLILYYVITAVSLFTLLNTFGASLLWKKLLNARIETLYAQATILADQYITNYYDDFQVTTQAMKEVLTTTDQLLDARIWVVSPKEGRVVIDTRSYLTKGTIFLSQLDEQFLDKIYQTDVFFNGVFKEPMLSIIASAASQYSIKGYLVLHVPMSVIDLEKIKYMDSANISILCFFGILLFIFNIIYLSYVLPIKRIKKAAMEYASGNFEYKIKRKGHDEFTDLANTLVYMVSEFKDMDEYQKKFIANISHDFRSPLTSIKGYVEAMVDGTIPYEMQERYLNIILFETDRLTKLTTNLLELNQIDAKAAMLEIVSFDINAMVKKTAATFEQTCIDKRLVFHLEFSEKELYVDADFGKTQQVLYNLIDNAIKFSNPDNLIRVATEERGNKAFISVKDFGIGIPKDSIKKIWDRFYKSDSSRGKDKKGTGLGLAIVKEILTAHNENISVVSTEGVGTEFIFTLPMTQF